MDYRYIENHMVLPSADPYDGAGHHSEPRKFCRDCNNYVHPLSEDRLCADCEYEGWKNELNVHGKETPRNTQEWLDRQTEIDKQIAVWKACKETV